MGKLIKIKKIIGRIPLGLTKFGWSMVILAEIAAFVLLILVVREVSFRYLFKAKDIFSVEVSEYLLVFICFMSIAWVLKENRHVKVEVLTVRLPRKGQLVTDIITSILVLCFCSVVAWKGTQVMLWNYHRGFRSSSLVRFPLWIPYFIIVLGIVALALQCVSRISEDCQSLRGGVKETSRENNSEE